MLVAQDGKVAADDIFTGIMHSKVIMALHVQQSKVWTGHSWQWFLVEILEFPLTSYYGKSIFITINRLFQSEQHAHHWWCTSGVPFNSFSIIHSSADSISRADFNIWLKKEIFLSNYDIPTEFWKVNGKRLHVNSPRIFLFLLFFTHHIQKPQHVKSLKTGHPGN